MDHDARRVDRDRAAPEPAGGGSVDNGVDAVLPTAPRAGRCPACEHRAGRPSVLRLPSWLRGPRPATCRVSDGVEDPSGWPTECGCTHPFHGS